MSEHYLKSLFDPQSIVLIGASTRRDTLGKLMFDQLSPDFKGDLYLVNPHHQNIDGIKCHKKIKNLPEDIDLAIVVTPVKTVVEVFRNCADKGIENVLLMTDLQHKKPAKIVRIKEDIIKIAKEHNIRILGPSAAALIRTTSQLNASFSTNQIHPGKLALVSRSKTLCNTILDWADKHEIGFSSVISHVEELDLSLSDILEFLINDYRTSSIVLHLDEIHHSRRFMSALRAAAIRKPVVLLKSSHDAGCYSDAIAKTSDVRSMDDVFHAAVTRAGADRVYTLSGLFSAAKILASNQRTQGTRLGIISNGEGPIMLANDRLSFFGIEIAKLSSALLSELKQDLEISQIKENAVLIADSKNTASGFTAAAKIMLKSGEIDALAILFAPDPLTNPVTVAEAMIEAVKGTRKPVLATWMGDSSIDQGRSLLTHNNISNYRTPEAAIDAFSFLCSHLQNRNLLLQIPYPLNKSIVPDIKSAKSIIQRNLKQKRNVLSQVDSRLLLESFHIPCNQSLGANSLDEALAIANDFGYPVVLKIDSPNITYKSDVNGVILNIRNATTLKKEYRKMLKDASELRPNAVIDGVIVERMYAPRNGRELMIRIINDPAFGPVISFGAGGTHLPALRDRAIQLPPLNRRLAENLINKSQVSLLLNNCRNLPAANRTQLQDVLIRVSEIATELPQVFELTINPLILDENQAMVNDSQVVIQNYDTRKKNYQHLAIHPYPSDWHRNIRIKNDISVNLRPIRAEDALAEVDFIKSMSKESKFFRFMHAVNDLTPEMLSRFTKLDYDREMAFAAFTWKNDKEIMLGVSRYSINPDKQSCEFAIAIADDWQGMGLARQLMLILIEHVKDRDIKVIEGTVLKNNTSMDKLMKSLGFSKSPSPDDYDINIYRCEIPKSSYAYL